MKTLIFLMMCVLIAHGRKGVERCHPIEEDECEHLKAEVRDIRQKLRKVLLYKKANYLSPFEDAESLANYSPEAFKEIANAEWFLYLPFIANITSSFVPNTPQEILAVILGENENPSSPLDCIVDELKAIGELNFEILNEFNDEIGKIQKIEKDFTSMQCAEILIWYQNMDEKYFQEFLRSGTEFLLNHQEVFIDYAPYLLNFAIETDKADMSSPSFFMLLADVFDISLDAAITLLGDASGAPENLQCLPSFIQEQLQTFADASQSVIEAARSL